MGDMPCKQDFGQNSILDPGNFLLSQKKRWPKLMINLWKYALYSNLVKNLKVFQIFSKLYPTFWKNLTNFSKYVQLNLNEFYYLHLLQLIQELNIEVYVSNIVFQFISWINFDLSFVTKCEYAIILKSLKNG